MVSYLVSHAIDLIQQLICKCSLVDANAHYAGLEGPGHEQLDDSAIH